MELRMLPAVVPSNGPPHSAQSTDGGVPLPALCVDSEDGSGWDGGYDDTRHTQTVSSSFSQAGPSSQRSRTGTWRSRDPRSKEKEARALFQELSQCEEYQKYRNRQPKGPQRQKDQKWPDNLEEAFFLALIFIPPMGRGKETVRPNEKPQGRNELIADYIQRLTGEPRDRKQVSSHIQVVKPFFKGNPRIMQYFSSKASSSRNRLHHPYFSSHANSVPNAVGGSRHYLQEITYGSVQRTRLEELRRSRPLEPSGFEMFVQVKKYDEGPAEPWRMITKFHYMPRRPDLYLDDNRQWMDTFPQLASMHSKSPLTCHIFSFEASLDIIPEQLPKGAELGITLDYMGRIENLPQCTFASRTRFFENETALKFVHDGELTNAINGPVEYDADESQLLGNVSFGSTFWARKLHELAQILRSRPGHRLPTPQDDCSDDSKEATSLHNQVRNAHEHVEAALKRLSAVQEIFAYPRNNPEDVQLVLVSTWNFSKSKPGEQAISTWRKVIPPPQQSQQLQQQCHDEIEFVSGLLSPQHSFKCPEQWDFSAEMFTEMNQAFDPSIDLSLDQQVSQTQPPRTLGSPIDLDSHMPLIGVPGYASIQDPLAAISNLPYPSLAHDDYDLGLSNSSSAAHRAANSHSIDPAIAAACSGPSAAIPSTNTIDFGGGHIALSFDLGEHGSDTTTGLEHPQQHPQQQQPAGQTLAEGGSLQLYAVPEDTGILDTTSLSVDMGPLEAIAETDIAAPFPVPFTSEQMQEYARRWGDFNGEVYAGATAVVEGYDGFEGAAETTAAAAAGGHGQVDLGVDTGVVLGSGGTTAREFGIGETEEEDENERTGYAVEM